NALEGEVGRESWVLGSNHVAWQGHRQSSPRIAAWTNFMRNLSIEIPPRAEDASQALRSLVEEPPPHQQLLKFVADQTVEAIIAQPASGIECSFLSLQAFVGIGNAPNTPLRQYLSGLVKLESSLRRYLVDRDVATLLVDVRLAADLTQR